MWFFVSWENHKKIGKCECENWSKNCPTLSDSRRLTHCEFMAIFIRAFVKVLRRIWREVYRQNSLDELCQPEMHSAVQIERNDKERSCCERDFPRQPYESFLFDLGGRRFFTHFIVSNTRTVCHKYVVTRSLSRSSQLLNAPTHHSQFQVVAQMQQPLRTLLLCACDDKRYTFSRNFHSYTWKLRDTEYNCQSRKMKRDREKEREIDWSFINFLR